MRRAVLTSLVLAVLSPLAAAQPRPGGTLVLGLAYELTTPDPHKQNIRQVTELVYEPLVEVDPQGGVVPGLANAWHVSDDGRRWTFRIREGIVFHDGTPLEARHVVSSYDRIRDPATASPRASDLSVVERIVAPDDRTIVFHLERPFSPLLAALSFSGHAIVKEQHGEEPPGQALLGTGPFRVTSYLPHAELVLERHDRYWRTDAAGRALPYLDGIEVRIMPDDATRTTALRSGAIDFVNLVPAPDVTLLEREPEIVLRGGPGNNQRLLAFNTARPPLDDVRVRRALAHAIDEGEIVRTAMFGQGAVARGAAIPHHLPFGIDSNPYVGRNLEEARTLLAEAGLADGFPLRLYTTSALNIVRAPAELIQADLAALGVDVEIVVEDFSLWLTRTVDRDFTAVLTAVPNEIDPDANLYAYFHSAGSLNIYGATDAALDALLDEGRRIADPEARRHVYAAAQERILDRAYAAYLFHSSVYEAMHQDVRGFEHSTIGSLTGLRATWLAR